MTLQEKLLDDLKESMRKGDSTRRSAIRYLRSAIHDEEIARRSTLDDEAVIGVLSKQAKQRRDSIEAFKEGHRDDLVEKEAAELAIITEYLPDQMSEEEIASLAKQAIDDLGATGPQEMGKVMGRLMPEVKGKADGKAVSAVVSNLLRGSTE